MMVFFVVSGMIFGVLEITKKAICLRKLKKGSYIFVVNVIE